MARDFYPFNYEDKVLEEGNRVVARMKLGHLCGYVAMLRAEVPEEWRGNYDAPGLQYLNVHGGITYCEDNGEWIVFGLDCAHAGDDENAQFQDPRYVMSLTLDMENQLRMLAEVYDAFKAADREGKIRILEDLRENAEIKERIGFGGVIDMMCGGESIGPSKEAD